MSGIESWSTTPANNNQAPPFGWPAGILPSQVEPIGRQMMTSLAAWYQAAEWINYNFTPVYVSATQFTIAGNVTSTLHVGRRVQATDGATSVYGTITVSAFTSLTTVTVVWDSGVLQTGVTIVYVGLTSKVNTSAPVQALTAAAFANPSATIGLTAVNGTATTAMSSDSAPPLSQAISPTWTGVHTFSNGAAQPLTVIGPQSTCATFGGPNTGAGWNINFKDTTNTLFRGFIGIGTGTVGGAAVTDFAISPGASGSVVIGTANGAAIATRFGPNGNVTINAPSSGVALTVTGTGSTTMANVTAVNNGNVAALLVSNTGIGAATKTRLQLNDNTADMGYLEGDNNGSIVSLKSVNRNNQLDFWTGSAGGAQRALINSTGNVTINAPGSGVALSVSAISGTHSTSIADSSNNLFSAGYLDIPPNAQTISYQLVLADRGKGIDFNGASLTCTIPANASVAFPIGSTIVVTNLNASSLSIAITTDTLTLAGTTTTGTRALAQNGMATIRKVTATSWLISGSGLS